MRRSGNAMVAAGVTEMAKRNNKASSEARAKTRVKTRAGKNVMAPAKPARRKRPRAPTAEATALAAFAHDFRTALTGILALGELLASSDLGDRERRWAQGIKSSAEHLAALTTLAVDAARMKAGTLTLQLQPFRPHELAEALAESLRARAATKGLEPVIAIAPGLPDAVVGDAVRLRAAVENLIDNAVKFTARGSVRLGVAATTLRGGKMRLAFTVADSGIGLKAAEIRRLFRPFAQANADIARRYGGTGLGLAIVKVLARRMGGDLRVTSMAGRGSTFQLTVVLPAAPDPAPAARSVAAGRGERVARPLSVLCVEDNPYGRVILNTILTELGHRADFAGSGEDALDALPRGYDAVLMDVTLPGIDGLETTRRIRALSGAFSHTPVVGISGRSEPGDERAARAAGINAYLRKPLSPSALQAALAAVSVEAAEAR
jgi:signal transduction histidine kinase/CheY-like chemotaxis protein